MSEGIIVQSAIQMMWLVLILSLPIIIVASAFGVLVSLLQALTQMQEQTLQFLVKLIAVFITLVISYRWMGDVLLNYATLCFEQIRQMRE